MNFDNVIPESCVPGNPERQIDPTTCSQEPPAPPSVDDRCADPAFRKANPDLCSGYSTLLLKPEYSITQQGGTVQFKTFIRTAGNEYEVENGLVYGTSDIAVSVINALSGLATGVNPGTVTISVTWQNLSAHAVIEVVATCSDVPNNILLLIDNSFSSKVGFSGAYATRLSYAKEAATRMAESVNYSKDKVGVVYFNEGGATVIVPSSDKAAVLSAIGSIVSTELKTNIYAGLQSATSVLDAVDGGRIIVLFSDGENNQGSDPIVLSDPWKEAKNLIIVIALRAWGIFFDKLYRIASVGYFLSAYEDTQVDVIETLKSIKGYFCSSDCDTIGGTFPTAQLNYNGFINWNVFQGAVDLIGLGLWDVQPGNGLYVDLAGTRNATILNESPGGLESKVAFSIVSGDEYSFSIDVAGNNVGVDNTDPVHVTIISEDGLTTFLDETITPTSKTQPFTTYTATFTAAETKTAKIKIEMVKTALSATNCGPLIDNIVFANVTASLVLLQDDFNSENLTYVPPGYSYYGGCLDEPVGSQAADPSPPTPPIEG